jgi:hypothetical protein
MSRIETYKEHGSQDEVFYEVVGGNIVENYGVTEYELS